MVRIPINETKIKEFCRKWKITEFSLFGSVVREDFRQESDVDVLVDFAPGAKWSLFDMGEMPEDLRELFGREVDLLSRRQIEKSENYIRRKEVLGTLENVYAA